MNFSHFSSRKVLEIEKIIIHERFESMSMENDIALLKLKEKVDLSIYTPACLAPKDANYTGKTASVYGWGRTQFVDPFCVSKLKPMPNGSSVLRQTTQTIESNDKCKQRNGTVTYCDEEGNEQLANVSMDDSTSAGYREG